MEHNYYRTALPEINYLQVKLTTTTGEECIIPICTISEIAAIVTNIIYVNASSSNGTFCTSNVGNCPKCIKKD